MNIRRQPIFRPKGPISLSPGHRPGWAPPTDLRPVGPRSGVAWIGAQRYHTPLVRGDLTDVNPGEALG
jgi:hypothetical protein